MLLLLGAVVGDLVSGSSYRRSHRWERSSVAFMGSGYRWLFSETVFGTLAGSNPKMVNELSLLLICELVCTKHVSTG